MVPHFGRERGSQFGDAGSQGCRPSLQMWSTPVRGLYFLHKISIKNVETRALSAFLEDLMAARGLALTLVQKTNLEALGRIEVMYMVAVLQLRGAGAFPHVWWRTAGLCEAKDPRAPPPFVAVLPSTIPGAGRGVFSWPSTEMPIEGEFVGKYHGMPILDRATFLYYAQSDAEWRGPERKDLDPADRAEGNAYLWYVRDDGLDFYAIHGGLFDAAEEGNRPSWTSLLNHGKHKDVEFVIAAGGERVRGYKEPARPWDVLLQVGGWPGPGECRELKTWYSDESPGFAHLGPAK